MHHRLSWFDVLSSQSVTKVWLSNDNGLLICSSNGSSHAWNWKNWLSEQPTFWMRVLYCDAGYGNISTEVRNVRSGVYYLQVCPVLIPKNGLMVSHCSQTKANLSFLQKYMDHYQGRFASDGAMLSENNDYLNRKMFPVSNKSSIVPS